MTGFYTMPTPNVRLVTAKNSDVVELEKKSGRLNLSLEESLKEDVRQFAARAGMDVSQFTRQALMNEMKGRPAAVTTVDLEGAPMLDMTVACGPASEAREEATMFYVSRQTADEMGLDSKTDYFIRARGESMERKGIVDEFAVLMSPLQVNRFPRKDEIALIAFEMGGGEVKGTLKMWAGQKGELPRLLNGDEKEVELPKGFTRWWPVAIAKGVVGGL